MNSEADVRDWVRKLPCPLTWVEAGIGGTSGQADVLVHADPLTTVSMELKLWKRSVEDGFVAKLRREQVRYHAVMQKQRRRTLIAWSSCNNLGLWVMSGFYAPQDISSVLPYDRTRIRYYLPVDRVKLVSDICANAFWPMLGDLWARKE